MTISAQNKQQQEQFAQARRDFVEDVEFLIDNGVRERETIASRLGITLDTFERRCQRWKLNYLIEKTYRYGSDDRWTW